LAFRSDGKRIRGLDPYFEIIPYIMNKRVDAQNFFNAMIPLQPIDEYIKQKRLEGKKISHLGLLIAAYVRMASQNPEMNRFVVNKRIYGRNHFCVSFVVLKVNKKSGRQTPTVVKAHFDLNETIFEVCDKLQKIIDDNRVTEYENPMDKLLSGLFYIPGLVSSAVAVFKFADRLGILPKSIIEGSPFHTSLFITNMASLRTSYIYHHIYEFGTTSIFIALGKNKTRLIKKDGEIKEARFMPLGVVTDERITDGHFYSRRFQEVEKYLKHPEILETPPEQIKYEVPPVKWPY